MSLKHYRHAGPILEAFINDRTFLSGIKGPFGSGKSTGAVMKALNVAMQMPPCTDGVRRSRGAVIRNTYPELKTTTIATWHQWLPKDAPGKWIEQGPPTHHLRLQTPKGEPVDMEVLFLALDSPQDVAKLLSLELTWAWINEAREVPKQVLDGLTGRVGRYPSQASLPTGTRYWSGIWMDTNPPDTDHWWYVLAEKDGSTEAGQQILESTSIAERELRKRGLLADDEPLVRFFSQPGARSDGAENLHNLDPAYYIRQMAGKTQDWINVYIDANYGYVQDGKPVYPEYNDRIHCIECEPIYGMPLILGVDFGLTPAAAICQVDMLGNWRVLDEIATIDMGAQRFAELLHRKLTSPLWKEHKVERLWGDPAGDIRAGTDERTPFDILKKEGLPAKPTHTNDPVVRREAVAGKLTRLDHNGKPSLIIHPRCTALRKAMMGAYKYRRIQVGGSVMQYADKPDKGPFSHIAEALQYALLGGGEGKALVRRADRRHAQQDYAVTDRPEYNGDRPKRQQFAKRY